MIFSDIPVPDRSIPPSPEIFLGVAGRLSEELQAGETVLVHCRQGIGRASMMAAAILAFLGVDPESGLQLVAHARGRPVPDTAEQRSWLTAAFRTMQRTAQHPVPADERRAAR
jgi:protein-tyrosine phosphatase